MPFRNYYTLAEINIHYVQQRRYHSKASLAFGQWAKIVLFDAVRSKFLVIQ